MIVRFEQYLHDITDQLVFRSTYPLRLSLSCSGCGVHSPALDSVEPGCQRDCMDVMNESRKPW